MPLLSQVSIQYAFQATVLAAQSSSVIAEGQPGHGQKVVLVGANGNAQYMQSLSVAHVEVVPPTAIKPPVPPPVAGHPPVAIAPPVSKRPPADTTTLRPPVATKPPEL